MIRQPPEQITNDKWSKSVQVFMGPLAIRHLSSVIVIFGACAPKGWDQVFAHGIREPIKLARESSEVTAGNRPGISSVYAQAGNVQSPGKAECNLLLDFPTGKESDTQAGNHKRLDRFATSKFEAVI